MDLGDGAFYPQAEQSLLATECGRSETSYRPVIDTTKL